MAAKGTPAIEAVRRAGVEHTVHEYPLPVATGREPRHSYGIEAAAALGIEPAARMRRSAGPRGWHTPRVEAPPP